MWVKTVPSTGKIRYCERYIDYLTGKPKDVSVTFNKDTAANRKEAAKLLAAKIAELSADPCVDMSLEKMVEEYRKDQRLTVRESTYQRNYYALETCKKMLGPDTIVDRLTSRYVRNQFLASGKPAGTLNELMRRFKAFYRWAYKSDLVTSTALIDKIERFADKPHAAKIENKYLESNELRAVIDYMTVPEWALLTEFMALSGLRFGEAIALKKTDIDLKQKVIHITKTFDSVNRVVAPPKTASSYADVIIQPQLEDVIHRINKQMLTNQMLYNYRSNLFICNHEGNYVEINTFNKHLKKATKAVAGKTLTSHALRHTHASLLFEQGFSFDEVARRLRHSDSRVTREIYVHITQKLRDKDTEHLKNAQIL